MRYYFAPMEGLTDSVYRRLHHKYFGGIDRYYMPFLSPTMHRCLSHKEDRELPTADSVAFEAVPQVLTKSAEDFLWAAKVCRDRGYREVNLNLGCPSGTVVAKGKGAGMLAKPEELDRFLEEIFRDPPIPISVKTRLGINTPDEFLPLLDINGDVGIVFFKQGDFAVLYQGVTVYAVRLNILTKPCDKSDIRIFLHLEKDIIASLKFNPRDIMLVGIFLYILAKRSERASTEPRKQTVGISAETYERIPEHTRISRGSARQVKSLLRVLFKVGVLRVLCEHLLHSAQNFGVYLTKVSGPGYLHFAVYLVYVKEFSLYVYLLDLPDATRKRKAVADGRGSGDSSYLLGALTDGKVLAVLEHRVEFETAQQPLSRKTYDKSLLLGHLKQVAVEH